MKILEDYKNIIIKALQNFYFGYQPIVASLYEPVAYALEGGKKLRPICVLMANDAYGGNTETALPAAVAIEMFHNFTLVHDDVMDNSPLRRGRQTVFNKWDTNQAILSGDAMLLLVYQILSQLPQSIIKPATELMSWAGLRVSEGQQLDMEFETKKQVSIEQYMQMIELKTAVLLGTSFKMGALVAGAGPEEQENIYQFGRNLGLAFQIQDDYLDLYADQDVFGKKIGNDIITNKKTFLLLKALELAGSELKDQLLDCFFENNIQPARKIECIRNIYDQLSLKHIVEQEIEKTYENSLLYLEKLNISHDWKQTFAQLSDYLMKRQK